MNRGALVTGASRGIGRAVAAAFARAGDQAAAHCNSSAREAEQVAASDMTFSVIDGPVGANAAALLYAPDRCALTAARGTGHRVGLAPRTREGADT
ncbi:SDR family NAD(P)-dependent oxidoreductase [Streptomyces sp. PA03-6a]|nr:SDR family NAD(P)-dependent oxidoreductase [Streptomyces sp. PA03-6a]